MSGQKNFAISAIRMIATLMIVGCHLAQTYRAEPVSDWLSTGVAMFFCLSACLYANRKISRKEYPVWLARKYCEITVPSVFVAVIATVVIALLTNEKVYIGTAALEAFGLGGFLGFGWKFVQLWFISYILLFYVLLPMLQLVPWERGSTIVLLGRLSVVAVICYGISAVLWFLKWPHLSPVYIICVVAAYALSKRAIQAEWKIEKQVAICAIPVAVGVAVACLLRYGNLPFVAEIPFFQDAQETIYLYVKAALGIELFFALYCPLRRRNLQKLSWLWKQSDRISYPVYLTHCLFIGYSTSIIRLFDKSFFGVMIALTLTMISSYVVYYATAPVLRLIGRMWQRERLLQSR